MGNPHPTNSKPAKIGRKHTLSPSIRQSARAKMKEAVAQQIQEGKHKRYKAQVAASGGAEAGRQQAMRHRGGLRDVRAILP